MIRRLVLPVLAAAAIVALTSTSAPALQIDASGHAGNAALTSDRPGEAIFRVERLAPGGSGGGEAEITNVGDADGALTLQQRNLTDVLGLHGGRMSSVLVLRIEDVSGPGAPVTLFDGVISTLVDLDLGAIDEGETRRFRFTVTLPDGGRPGANDSGDNIFQLASTTVDYRFVVANAKDDDDDDDDKPQPEQPLPPGGSAGEGVVPATQDPIVEVPLSSATPSRQGAAPRLCTSRRRFRIRLREPRGARLRSARVTVNGKRVRVTRRFGRLTAVVTLRGAPRSLARVRIVARTRSGRRLAGTRTYFTCAKKRPDRRQGPL